MALNERQKAFASEYLKDFNATQAAIRAGYSPKTAYSQGQRLLKHAEMQKMLGAQIKKREKRTEITQDMVIKELAKIAFEDIADFVEIADKGLSRVKVLPIDKMGKGSTAAINSIKEGPYGLEIKLHDKVRALEDLGKHFGIFGGSGEIAAAENNLLQAIRESTKDGE